MTKGIQTKLVEPMLTERWPKNHKLREPKKHFLTFYEPKEESFSSIMERLEELGRDTYVVGWSGGKDGGVVLDKTLKSNREIKRVFYIRTNTGVQLTEDFLKDQCQSMGLKLDIREPTPHAFVYVAICLEVGFPDYGLHDMVMSYLKYKTMMKYLQEPQFKKLNTVLLSGVRKFESTRRKLNYENAINVDAKKYWFGCPIFYEKDNDVYRYYIENGLKRSPVYDMGSQDSMECKCGCFAGKGELEIIRKIDPNRAEFFEWLTIGIKKFGKDLAKKHTTWGGGDWTSEERNEVITKYLGDDADFVIQMSKIVCGSECGAGTMRGLLGN